MVVREYKAVTMLGRNARQNTCTIHQFAALLSKASKMLISRLTFSHWRMHFIYIKRQRDVIGSHSRLFVNNFNQIFFRRLKVGMFLLFYLLNTYANLTSINGNIKERLTRIVGSAIVVVVQSRDAVIANKYGAVQTALICILICILMHI